MPGRRNRIALFLLIFLFSSLLTLRAQNLSLAGVVRDGTRAVVPGASLALALEGGNFQAITVADGEGNFKFALSSAGTYKVTAQAEGFAVWTASVIVSADKSPDPLDIVMVIGPDAQTVEVTADTLAAETTSTQLGEAISSAKIQSVPLNGRDFTDLMAIQPGIVPENTAQPGAVIMTGVASTPPSGDANPGNLSISGQREASNGFRVNGSDVEEDVNMGTSIVPNLDSIDSFRVLTSNFDAEYGNSSGGEVLVTTKSGSDQWHGSAFEFLRNTQLDARNYFSQDRAAYRQNQFGAALGGTPIRGGAAFFADYQGTRLSEGVDTGVIAIPSVAERTGDFSQNPLTGNVSGPYLASLLSARMGSNVTAGEPYSEVFANGQIPRSAWSAPAQFLLNYIPAPNASSSTFSTSSQAESLQDDKGAMRVDWARSKGSFTFYYFFDGYSLLDPYPTGTGGASVPGFRATSNGLAQLASLAQRQTFGDTALNELHLSFMRNANAVGRPVGGVGLSLAAQGFTGIVGLKPSTVGVENVSFNNFTMGVDTTALVQAENIFEISDAFSRIVGKHGLKFGGEFHADEINTHPDVVFNGSFSFNGSETGLDFADFLIGTPSSFTQGQARDFYNRNRYVAAFAQDSWKATNQVTINYGVRWDRIRPWNEKFNQLQTLVQGEQSQVFPGAPLGLVFPGDPGVPRSLAGARNDFAPRIGIAWSPASGQHGPWNKLLGEAGRTSIRLGYGMFYTAY